MALERFETISVSSRATEPLPGGRLSATQYRSLHRHLFQDVYVWAGSYRHVRIRKGDSVFCYPENIDSSMAHLFKDLQSRIHSLSHRAALVPYAAHFLSELNAIHPFREGNGRTQLVFLTVVAAHCDFRFEPSSLDPASFLNAMIRAFEGNEEDLTYQLNELIE